MLLYRYVFAWKNHVASNHLSSCNARCTSESVELVGLCDASLKAYAATVYLQNQSMCCSLIVSKTRVAPLPTQIIPRLELLGALLLAILMASVQKSLGDIVNACKCFTDPTIVLHEQTRIGSLLFKVE